MCQEYKQKYNALVISNDEISPNIYKMIFEQKNIAYEAVAGQFVNLYCRSKDKLLPRPISLCEIDKEHNLITIVYATIGKGTEELSKIKKDETVKVMGPFGNGFKIDDSITEHLIIGGGVGTPPLLELVKHLKGNKKVCLGFRTEPYLLDEFSKYAQVYIATQDGSVGTKGTVMDVIKSANLRADMVYACGPKLMLKAIKEWTTKIEKIPAQLSLEERMGCGFGACVGCVCKIKKEGEKDWTYKKVCKDGPIFWAKEVIFDE